MLLFLFVTINLVYLKFILSYMKLMSGSKLMLFFFFSFIHCTAQESTLVYKEKETCDREDTENTDVR